MRALISDYYPECLLQAPFTATSKRYRLVLHQRLKSVTSNPGDYQKQRTVGDTLPGCQQQWVAIARAMAQELKVFLADEPIASLDPPRPEKVMHVLFKTSQTQGISVIVNPHHIDFALP